MPKPADSSADRVAAAFAALQSSWRRQTLYDFPVRFETSSIASRFEMTFLQSADINTASYFLRPDLYAPGTG